MEARILRLREVMDRVGLGKSAIYSKISKGEFPRPLYLGPRSVGWRSGDIEAWINNLPLAAAGRHLERPEAA